MTQILIKNGVVYDPLNNIKGEVMDIAIKDGKIVDPKELNPYEKIITIDASGKVVMPGGIDIHSHIAGPKVNSGRLLRPEDHYTTNKPDRPPYIMAETGLSTPNVYRIGYEYAIMGYTVVAEPATPPVLTRHTHHEFNAIPIIDKLAYVIVDSNWLLLDLVKQGDINLLAAYLAWVLRATKTYSLKLVDPGSDFVWQLKGGSVDIYDQIPIYGITPADIIESVANAAQLINIPHKVHIHCNRLGYPGNYITTLKTMELSPKIQKLSEGLAMHITHVQFTGYKGDSWISLESGGEEIAKELNRNPYISLDLGQAIPGRSVTTMTGDAPFEFVLYHLMRGKWYSVDTESDGAAGIVPYKYRKKNYVNTIQWVIGLEITLLADDLQRVFIATDHPNAGLFTDYPLIFAWLMSKKAREDTMKNMNQRALKRSALPAIDRELTLYDIALMTRASPAKLLGLQETKGHLGIGADADVAIYDINPFTTDPSKDYTKIITAFRRAWITIKDGEIVVNKGEVINPISGATYYVDPAIPEDLDRELYKVLSEKVKQYYSVTMDTFIIDEKELLKYKRVETKSLIK
jgi:formylmethanofuran dehydrogenase subunit A